MHTKKTTLPNFISNDKFSQLIKQLTANQKHLKQQMTWAYNKQNINILLVWKLKYSVN